MASFKALFYNRLRAIFGLFRTFNPVAVGAEQLVFSVIRRSSEIEDNLFQQSCGVFRCFVFATVAVNVVYLESTRIGERTSHTLPT